MSFQCRRKREGGRHLLYLRRCASGDVFDDFGHLPSDKLIGCENLQQFGYNLRVEDRLGSLSHSRQHDQGLTYIDTHQIIICLQEFFQSGSQLEIQQELYVV